MPPRNAAPEMGDPSDITERSLLQSIVEVARSVFGAAAASVFLLDEQTDELVFEAVAGEGEDDLIGMRFPSGTGLAGWVAMSGQSLLVDDVNSNPQFARDAAESTGYVPTSHHGRAAASERRMHRRARSARQGHPGARGTLRRGPDRHARHRGGARARTARPAAAAERKDGPRPTATRPLLQRIALRLPSASGPVASTVSRLLVTADDLLADATGG